MHTFPCQCGHTIAINSPSEAAGYVVWDAEVDASIAARRSAVQSFLTALSTGQRDAWLRYFYGTDANPSRFAAQADADIIEDILSKHDDYTHLCYRCNACGSMYMQQRPGTDDFQEYRPTT